jgi:hypothetical protein
LEKYYNDAVFLKSESIEIKNENNLWLIVLSLHFHSDGALIGRS